MDDREEMRRLIDMIEKSAGSNTIEQAVDDLKTFANTASFLANKLDSRLKAGEVSKNEAKVERYLRNYDVVVRKLVEVEEKDRVRNFEPPVSGEDIMAAFSIPPCRPIGAIKNVIKDAIMDGAIPNEPVAARALMMKVGPDVLDQWRQSQSDVSAGKRTEKEARDAFDAWLEALKVSPSNHP